MAELQRLLEDSQRQLEGGQALAAQQAQRVAALEERIRLLLRQLEAAQQAGGMGNGRGAEDLLLLCWLWEIARAACNDQFHSLQAGFLVCVSQSSLSSSQPCLPCLQMVPSTSPAGTAAVS